MSSENRGRYYTAGKQATGTAPVKELSSVLYSQYLARGGGWSLVSELYPWLCSVTVTPCPGAPAGATRAATGLEISGNLYRQTVQSTVV